MKDKIYISYIIPCYNVQDYLLRCLESLSQQKIDSDEEIEYILINDGSTDNTLSILKDFSTKGERAIVIDQKNQGVSAARNAGLKIAKGEYVFFLDSDDWLTDDASQILYDVGNKAEPDIIITNAFKIDEEALNVKREWDPCMDLREGVYGALEFAHKVHRLPFSFKAYKREMLMSHHIQFNDNLRVGEVYAFFLDAMSFSQSIAFTDKRVMNYLVRDNSVMRTVDLERDYTIIDTMHYIEENTKKQMPELLLEASYKRSLFDIVYLFSFVNYVNKTSYTSEIGSFLKQINRDSIFKDLKKYFIFKEKGRDVRKKHSWLHCIFPVSISYRLMRYARFSQV